MPPEEPAAGPWRVAPLDELVRVVLDAAGAPAGRPRVVAVDGRSAGGKSTLAVRLHGAAPRSAVVHTDDVAWHHSFFDWTALLAQGVLEPVRRGEAVRYRPPAWVTRGRSGAIEVPAGLDLVLVDGVIAGRRELAHLLDAVVWVQSDSAEAERRGIARDVEQGMNGDRAGVRAGAVGRGGLVTQVSIQETTVDDLAVGPLVAAQEAEVTARYGANVTTGPGGSCSPAPRSWRSTRATARCG